MYSTTNHHDIDQDGYRRNVGIVVCNNIRQVLWARRIRQDGWQFPQGGARPDESDKEAVFRELQEEIGLQTDDVRLLGATSDWLKYDVPYTPHTRSARNYRQFRGQKQRWFLFQLIAQESRVQLDCSASPEFDCWRWIDYWQPLEDIVEFKKLVYQRALTELEPLLPQIDPDISKDK